MTVLVVEKWVRRRVWETDVIGLTTVYIESHERCYVVCPIARYETACAALVGAAWAGSL